MLRAPVRSRLILAQRRGFGTAQAPNVTTSCGSFAPSLLLYQTALPLPSFGAKLYAPSPTTAVPRSNSTHVPTGAEPPAASSEPTAGLVDQVVVPSPQPVSLTP